VGTNSSAQPYQIFVQYFLDGVFSLGILLSRLANLVTTAKLGYVPSLCHPLFTMPTQSSVSPLEHLQQAIVLHQAGQLEAAARAYTSLLNQLPKNTQLLTQLATLRLQQAQILDAFTLFSQSLQLDPQQPNAWYNAGIALQQAGQLETALDFFTQALTLKPDFAEAYNNQGHVLKQLGRIAEAIESFTLALKLQPSFASAYNNCGAAKLAAEQYTEALADFELAISLQNDYAKAYTNKGLALQQLKHLTEALACFEQALILQPQTAETFFNQGNVLLEMQELEAALLSFNQAISLDPAYYLAYLHQGATLHGLNRLPEALNSFEQALDLQPAVAQAYILRGNTLQALARYAEALACYTQALSIDTESAEAYNNQGAALQELGQLPEAIQSYQLALGLQANYVEALCNLGAAWQKTQQLEAADRCFAQAMTIKPAYAPAFWNQALLKLLQGDYAQGWLLYEWRWKVPPLSAAQRHYTQPLWLGDADIQHKTLLLYPEQGYGDFIQFVRYLPLVTPLAAKVILEVPSALFNLAQTLPSNCLFIASGNQLPDFDCHCPLLSLPLALQTRLDTIPAQTPYLFANNQQQVEWQDRLGSKTQLRVGLVWTGAQALYSGHKRSILLEKLTPLLNLAVDFHCLQKDFSPADSASLKNYPALSLHDSDLHDFAETAALIAEMDLVISIDTAVAHLAGALGKPVWILLPYAADYRWLTEREDSPWYPSARLFRQTAADDWAGVISRVVAALIELNGVRFN
jgi:tetratricopeptide (TPR) repeat protein